MHRREVPDQITEQMDDTARIFVAKAAEFAIGATRIEWEDCFEMWRLLLGDGKLLGAETGNADHANIAVAPILHFDPFDQIVAVPFTRAAALRLADPAWRTDHMYIAARDQKLGVAGLYRPCPQRRPRGLRWQNVGQIGTLQVFVVDGEGQQCGKFSGRIRAVDIDADVHAVAHWHHDIDVAHDLGEFRRAIVIRSRMVRRSQEWRRWRPNAHYVPRRHGYSTGYCRPCPFMLGRSGMIVQRPRQRQANSREEIGDAAQIDTANRDWPRFARQSRCVVRWRLGAATARRKRRHPVVGDA